MRRSPYYREFIQVYEDTKKGMFHNEAELRHAFVEALKSELFFNKCNRYIVENLLVPRLDETIKRGRPDVVISNLVIEIEPPRSGLDIGRKQLYQYMKDLYDKIEGRIEIYGLVTDGVQGELWMYNGDYILLGEGEMPDIAKNAILRFCSQKIPIVEPDDLIKLFGV